MTRGAPAPRHRQPECWLRHPARTGHWQATQRGAAGGDLRQLARADDGTLLVTDYSGDRLLLLDDELELEKAIPTGHRPYGVIFDAKRQWFWVTLFESGRLQAYDRAGNLQLDAKPPRLPAGWH